MRQADLAGELSRAAQSHQVPGASVGVYHAGTEWYACHGVTSVDNPLPVDEGTLFQVGSVGKTITATVVMCLVERGQVDLDQRVRHYLPGFRVRDESVSRDVTIRHLLNHTAGWPGDLEIDTGEGDDALARYIELMADFGQDLPLGAGVSYNNASLSVAARVIEVVTGHAFEQVVHDFVLEPLELRETFFFKDDIMTRRFAAGHQLGDDGAQSVVRPYSLTRAGNGAGGSSSSVRDLLAWARFQLGDGQGVLSTDSLAQMRRPTAYCPGSVLGDAIGLVWMLRQIGDTPVVFHPGTHAGQHASLLLVPEADLAMVSLTNGAPGGHELNRDVERWVLTERLGLAEPAPRPVDQDGAVLEPFTGRYETIAATIDVTSNSGGLQMVYTSKEEAVLSVDDDGNPVPPPVTVLQLGLLDGPGDRYVAAPPHSFLRGFFAREADGRISAINFGGRLAPRSAARQPVTQESR